MEKVDLQPTDDKSSDYVALDETVIQLTDQRYWLFAAVDLETEDRGETVDRLVELGATEVETKTLEIGPFTET